jgi:DNA primase
MSRQAIDELKRQISLLDYVQAHHGQAARPLSRGRWMGLCPLHADRNPSFLVDSHQNLFYCYGCGRGGDVIRFAELYHQVEFHKRWRCCANGVGWGLSCRKPPISIAFSCLATERQLLICTNVGSTHRN